MRNEKGEDWEKYMSEMKNLQPFLRREMGEGQGDIAKSEYHPILNDKGVPVNDPTVKKRDKAQLFDPDGNVVEDKKKRFTIIGTDEGVISSTVQKHQKQVDEFKKNVDKYVDFMQRTMNSWIEENVMPLFNSVEKRSLQEGNNWPIKKKRIYIEIAHSKDPLPIGSDLVTIMKKKEVVAQQKFVWDV